MKNFSIHGTETGSQISRRLDEIVVCGSPNTIRDLGLFLSPLLTKYQKMNQTTFTCKIRSGVFPIEGIPM